MINKEIVLGNGNIVKDFIDRNIPQNSHNQVCVSFLIPSNQFDDLDDYSVFTAVSRIVGNSETTLNSLVLTASKSITIEGINYIKFSCVLSLDYTNVLGELRFSPYVQKTIHTDSVLEDLDNDEEEEVITEYLLSQNSYTNVKLNIIKAVRIQEDASLEDATIATTLAGQINSKKIYYNATWNDISVGNANTLYYNIATSYNPSVALYNGSIVAIKNQNVVSFYFPYLNGANTELLLMTNDGLFYKISSISRTLVDEGLESEHYEYSATKTQLSYSKSEIDSALNLKADKSITINGYDLSQDRTLTKSDIGLGNVANYGVETTQPTASGDQLYITSKAVYDALQTIYGIISGMATEEQITTINNRLTAIEDLLGDGSDDDNIINTLYEVVQTLSGLGEDANILSMINSKVSQSDFDTLNSQINGTNGIATKVSFLYDSNANAYAEIKAQSGTIDILTTDWVANSDANYPYKWELSNGYLVGASYVSVVFDKDSDTSMLSASVGIDDENGKVILYASELPSATISIQLIAIFNSVNAYVLYNQTLVSQVASNTSAISEINNTKLPYLAKNLLAYFGEGVEKTLRITQTANSNGESQTIAVEKLITGASGNENESKITIRSNEIIISRQLIDYASPSNEKSYAIYLNDTDGFKVDLGGKNNGTPYRHYLTFDANGDLKIDGNAVGGGGSQLYQHNIRLYASSNTCRVLLTIINDSNIAFTLDSLKSYLRSNFNNNSTVYLDSKYILVNGMTSEGTYANKMVIGLCYYTVASNIAVLYENGAVVGQTFTSIQDTIITL